MRFSSKQELIESIEKEHRAFVEIASSVPRMRYREEGVWGDGWTVKDLLAHLNGVGADVPGLVPRGAARWREPGAPRARVQVEPDSELNRAIWNRHRGKSLKKVLAEFKDGLLWVFLPEREEAKPKQIEVKVK
jgi:hypothetical protein